MTCKPTLVTRATAPRSAAIVQPPTQKKNTCDPCVNKHSRIRKKPIFAAIPPDSDLRKSCENHMAHTKENTPARPPNTQNSFQAPFPDSPLATPPKPAPRRKCQLAPSSQLGLQVRKPSEIYSPGGGHSKNRQKPIKK